MRWAELGEGGGGGERWNGKLCNCSDVQMGRKMKLGGGTSVIVCSDAEMGRKMKLGGGGGDLCNCVYRWAEV